MLFKIQYSDILVPGPMAYSKNMEALIIANDSNDVESYRYEAMKVNTTNKLEVPGE